MRTLKKATAIALTVVMMFSTVVGVNTVQAENSEYQALVLDKEATVTVDEYNRGAYFSFTPQTSDYYIFKSLNAPYDLQAYVDIYEMTDSGIDPVEREYSNSDGNFTLSYFLTAGKTYYYDICHHDELATGTYQVVLSATPVASAVFEPISITEKDSGYYQTDYMGEEYFYYDNWQKDVRYTITMKDGGVAQGSGWGFSYNNEYYPFEFRHNQDQDHWTIGNTYPVTVVADGYQGQVQVSIVECPVQSVTIQPITIIENTTGSLSNQGTDDEYFYYNWTHKINAIITMKNGDIVEVENSWDFCYKDQWYSFSQDNEQWKEHWEVGNTYTVTTSVMGYKVDVNVSIVESPVESIVVEPISIIENTNGSYPPPGSPNMNFRYEWVGQIKYIITMKDGTIVKGSGFNFEYNGERFMFETGDNQYTTPWTVGNTYTVTVNALGCHADVKVTIKDSPVESFEIKPIVIAEYTNGSHQNMGTPDEWFYYHWENLMEYTITMKDGEVLKGKGTSVLYEGNQYHLLSYGNINQMMEHWYAGNTYSTTANFLGKTETIEISILEKNQTDGFEYIVQDGNAIISGSSKTDTVLNIPAELDGYPVIGITDLTYAMDYAEELVIPDSVTMLSASIFEWNYDLKKLTLGKGISNINNDMFLGTVKLEEIIVSEENPYYCSVDGAVYDKEMKTLVVFPRAKKGAYTVPDTVTDIDCLINNISYYEVQLDLGNSKTDYAVEDGVIYNTDKTVIYACDKTQTGKYVMPDTVTTIHEAAFQKCSFSEVVVSENVSEIVYAAFSYSMELEKVVLPQNLKAISSDAFIECGKLKEAELPSGLETMEARAFSKTSITNVTIPGTLTQVGYGAYKESQVAELTLEEGIEVIWKEAFAGTQLKTVQIPNSITHMGQSVFANTPIESVKIGSGLDRIPDGAFQNTRLKTVTIPENIAEIGAYAFADSPLEEAVIEKNDVYIFEGAFCNCPLKEIDLKDGVVAVSDYAYYGNDAEGVIIPESVTDVTYKSFAESKKLVEIDVPDNLTSIDGTAFDGTAWWDAQADGVVYLENYLYGYKGTMPEGTEITVNDGTALIADYAFNNEYNLKTLSIPSSVTGIGWSTLAGCLGLEKVTVAEGNTGYSTNDDGTILYNSDKFPIWRKVVAVNGVDLQTEVEFGTSAEDWLANYPWQSVYVEYVDGEFGQESCSVTPDMVSGYNGMKPGWQRVIIDFGQFDCETKVYVEMPEVANIKIGKLPNRTVYDLNQALRTTGMVVKGVSPNGTEFEITDYFVSELDASEAGIKTITVAYMDFEATFEVEVIAEKVTYTATTNTSEVNLEVSVPEGVIDNEAELVVEEKPVGEIIEEQEIQVPEIFKENDCQIFDIRFEKEVNEGTGEPEIETVQPTEPVKVSIPVPFGMDGSNCKVYHISNGVPQDMKATYSGGYMVFNAPHFSYYGIVEVTGSSISGLVEYAGAVAGDITVTLSKDNEVCDSVIAVDGAYNFTGVQAGTYVLKFEKAGHAAREYELKVGTRSLEKAGQIHLIGDINGDGKVNSMDKKLIYNHMNDNEKALTDYDFAVGDVNGDDSINALDKKKVYNHLNGELLW